MGVEQGAKARVGAEPKPGLLLLAVDGALRTLIHARGAALAGQWVDAVRVVTGNDGFEATYLVAAVAELAEVRVDNRHLAAHENVLFQFGRLEDQLQVGGVHVGVGQDDGHV